MTWPAAGCSSSLAGRAIVHRGIDREELPAGTPGTVLMDALAGAVMSHALASASAPPEQVQAGLVTYPEDLVGVLLRGVGATD